MEAEHKFTVRTRLLAARRILEVLPNEPVHAVVTSFTKRIVILPKHLRLASLTEPPTVTVKMLDEININLLGIAFECVNICR